MNKLTGLTFDTLLALTITKVKKEQHFEFYSLLTSEFDRRAESSFKESDTLIDTFTLSDFLKKLISKADYTDILLFERAYAHLEYKDEEILRHIGAQMSYLSLNKLDSFHKSENKEKHHHYLYWMNKFLHEEKTLHLRFFVVNSGNMRSFDTIYMGTNESESFDKVLNYIIDKNIVPDPFYHKIEVPDFVNPDIYQPRHITSSGRFGGFTHLVYLNASELQEMYKTKIKRHKLNYVDKASWAFINASSSDPETKFYLFVS